MVRRASSRIPISTVLLCAFIVLAAIGIGSYYFIAQSNPYRTIAPFDTAAYLQGGNSLRGNIYRIDGVVDDSLSWSSSTGRLISVTIHQDDKETPDRVAILVPTAFNHVNLQKGQRYQFKVEIGKDGVIEADDMRKS